MRIILLIILATLFWISGAFAEPEYLSNGLRASGSKSVDVRLKSGFAAGIDKIELPDIATTKTADTRSSNIQIEVAISPLQGSKVGPVFSLGPFMRTHSGNADDPLIQGTINYDASGLCFSGGLWIKASDSLYVEVKAEFGFGSGWATLSNTRFVSGQTQGRSYVSGSAILGLYYSASKPGFQIGLELGWQSFGGRFEVQNSAGKHWEGGSVEGSGITTDLALGYRF